MTDFELITNLINQADQLASEKNVAAYLQLFTENGAITGAEGTAQGQGDLEKFLTKTWEKEPLTQHLTTSVIIEDISATKAHASSALLIVDTKKLKILGVNQVEHTLVKQNQKWQFSHRLIK
ncbi:nuclear transport factor 2 family protein [Enterococcus sp. HY326]|uniref:nuclear transport factor 2 family protein n=1 Tax=Enterococcus sp. HY326 TaxID=2971265 RepID=UPI00224036E9|nr:nuclear transport factor 2 family protein [Enterococcus sp. HY326]